MAHHDGMLWLLLHIAVSLASPGLAETSAGCGACHTDEHAQWTRSRHAVARSNEVFTASYDNFPHPWCLSCHAPVEENGVGCTTCHATDRPADCASCHEFPFQLHTPTQPFTLGSNPAQETVTEWERSSAAAAGTTCIDCHMGANGHSFPGGHSPELVRGLLAVSTQVRSATEVEVTVRAPGAAHRVPTGDPFRRIEVRLATDAACERVVGSTSLRRVIERTENSWRIREDRTVPPETPTSAAERVLLVEVSARPTHWCLDYRYGDRRFEADLPEHAVGYRVASGTIDPG